jgi:mono/diheme cytochrome c family protein
MKRRLPIFVLALLAAPALRADDAPGLTGASGAELFARLCVSCHGATGRGDGPVSDVLRVAPADLTRINARNGGTFPETRVREAIDGRAVLPAHGTREMPVWGYELEASVPAGLPGRAAAQAMTDRLVGYLRSLQAP